VVDDGVEIGLESPHALAVGFGAVQHVEVIRRVSEVGARRDRFVAVDQACERGDDGRGDRDDRRRFARRE
jgi:hypothetical protein